MLVNRSGHGITSVCITPSTDTDWGENYVDELLGDGESVLAVLGTYKESEIPGMWNILVYGEEDYILYDTSVDELDFELTDGDYVVFLPPEGEVPIEITNHYNPDEYDETPEDYSDDLTGYTFEEEEDLSVGLAPFVGCWKYDEEPFYLVIGDDYEWVAINLYGERVNPGQVVVQEGDIALYLPDGNYFTTLNETAYGGLSDEKGNSLTACDDIILLPDAGRRAEPDGQLPRRLPECHDQLSEPDGGARASERFQCAELQRRHGSGHRGLLFQHHDRLPAHLRLRRLHDAGRGRRKALYEAHARRSAQQHVRQ